MERGINSFSTFTYPSHHAGFTNNDPQIRKEAFSANLNSLLQSGPIQETYESWTEYFESPFPSSTFPKHDDIPPASIEKTANIDFSEQRYGCTPVLVAESTSNLTVSSISTETSRKKRADVSLRPARQVAGMRVVPKRLYSCDICGKKYSQPQGVSRHRHVAHDNPHSCLRCEFKWSRPYQYRVHLEKWHPDVDPNNVLGKSAGSHSRSTIIGRDLPQHFPLPTVDSYRRSPAELGHWQRPVTLLLPEAAKVTHVSRPAMLFLAYNPLLKHVEPAVTSRNCEDDQVLELSDATDTPSAFSSTGECSQSVYDVGVSIQRANGQLWLPSARPGGSTAANRPSSP